MNFGADFIVSVCPKKEKKLKKARKNCKKTKKSIKVFDEDDDIYISKHDKNRCFEKKDIQSSSKNEVKKCEKCIQKKHYGQHRRRKLKF